MKFLTIIGAILVTAQPLLAQGPPRQVCCDAVVMGFDQRPTGIQCVPMTSDCIPSRRTAAVCFLNEATHIGDWCQNVQRAPPRP